MKEILYKYSQRGMYCTEDETSFASDSHVKIIIEPHDFSIAIGGEVIRSSSCKGYTAIASCEGEVVFYDSENNIICRTAKSDNCYKQVVLKWEQDLISIQFGRIIVVDHYPNCDGEYDRYEKEWVTERSVTLNEKDGSVIVK